MGSQTRVISLSRAFSEINTLYAGYLATNWRCGQKFNMQKLRWHLAGVKIVPTESGTLQHTHTHWSRSHTPLTLMGSCDLLLKDQLSLRLTINIYTSIKTREKSLATLIFPTDQLRGGTRGSIHTRMILLRTWVIIWEFSDCRLFTFIIHIGSVIYNYRKRWKIYYR